MARHFFQCRSTRTTPVVGGKKQWMKENNSTGRMALASLNIPKAYSSAQLLYVPNTNGLSGPMDALEP